MNELPAWWNDLVAWFFIARRRAIPPNMLHAWRINGYADSVCNGGLADYLRRGSRRAFSNADLLQSLTVVGSPVHVTTLERALAFLRDASPRRRLPEAAQMARGIAYDCLCKGLNREQTVELLIELTPECPESLYDKVLDAAARELAFDSQWEALNAQFFAEEPALRLCIAAHAERYMSEWRGSAEPPRC